MDDEYIIEWNDAFNNNMYNINIMNDIKKRYYENTNNDLIHIKLMKDKTKCAIRFKENNEIFLNVVSLKSIFLNIDEIKSLV
jgi:hypothetical protein